ncbi:MAG: hypothetical protein AAF215_34980 [Cyanobacteria bacterium P01_A01_bin.123]
MRLPTTGLGKAAQVRSHPDLIDPELLRQNRHHLIRLAGRQQVVLDDCYDLVNLNEKTLANFFFFVSAHSPIQLNSPQTATPWLASSKLLW